MNKYKITDDRHPVYTSLKRIQALTDFGTVKTGDLGGFIESYNNLDVGNTAWVFNDSLVFRLSRVLGNAQVRGHSRLYDESYVYGNALIYSTIMKGHSRVFDHATVHDSVLLQNTWVHQYANCTKCILTDDVAVYGHSTLNGVKLKGWTRVCRSTS